MNALELDTVRLSEDGRSLVILDQTLLPNRVEYLALRSAEAIREAIFSLRVRGAPAIGVAAALGLAVCAADIESADEDAFFTRLREISAVLASARPTAVNLFWALQRMEKRAGREHGNGVTYIKAALFDEANRIREEDIAISRGIGEHGLALLHPGCGVLTHCNAGTLATTKYGTATAPLYIARERGMSGIRVYCDETRPLLQGARLTALELSGAGFDTTLLCDNMAASLMAAGRIDLVLVGCDRVARNGDAANKIGTLGVAILAKHFGIPFYVCAPSSTVDMALASGAEIPIEQRPGSEVTEKWYAERMAPADIGVYNPAFDVTPSPLITGIITERGLCSAPYESAFRAIGLG